MQNDTYEPLPLEKIISALSYFTAGIVGFIWLILGAVLKLGLKPFLRYHIYQSVFLSFLFFIISTGLSLVLGVLGYVPIINRLVSYLTFYISTGIFGSFSILNLIFIAFVAYLVITSLMGKMTYVPWVSNIIKENINY